jgi:ArsR family transcriptional regulator
MDTDTEQMLTRLRAIADPIRLRLVTLCVRGECSVSELTEVLGQSQPRVSQQLKILCDAGLLQRFRDGHFVYYRGPSRGKHGSSLRRLLALFDEQAPDFRRDIDRLRALRSSTEPAEQGDDDRALHHALVELTVTDPLGDLIDIGCGQGRVLKLLASRAQRAVGVDIDADARRFARAQVLLAGLPNCTLRKGDMYSLPFADDEFDTVILDDVLGEADQALEALLEARRLMRPAGRMLLLNSVAQGNQQALKTHFAAWCRAAELRLTVPKLIPVAEPRWLLAVATLARPARAAA